MVTRTIVLLALALALVSSHALAATVRNSPVNVGTRGVSSIASAAARVPPGAPSDDGSIRDTGREQKHDAMMQKLILDLRARRSVQAPLAPLTLPRVAGLRLGEDESGFGFKGLSNLDQANVNMGFSVEPPDQALCVGNGYVFEGVNSAFAVYSETGRLLAGPAQANAFFGVDFSLNVSDPKCIYDAASNRWFVTMTEYDNTFTLNHVMIAVSQTGDPTGSFLIYDIDVTNDGSDFIPGGADCPCLGDQPLIGADANGFYVSTNAFGFFSYEGA